MLKYAPPPDATPAPAPPSAWRLYVFKGGAPVGGPGATLSLRPPTTAVLFGRDRAVADIPTDHPSCSKQHAVLQFRRTVVADAHGLTGPPTVRPYLVDLESANGTLLNGDRVEAGRFYELRSGDVVRCGASSREYVLLREDARKGG